MSLWFSYGFPMKSLFFWFRTKSLVDWLQACCDFKARGRRSRGLRLVVLDGTCTLVAAKKTEEKQQKKGELLYEMEFYFYFLRTIINSHLLS